MARRLTTRPADRVTVYRGQDGKHYWRKVRRGRVVSIGGEGYARPSGAFKAAKRENPGCEVIREA